MTLDRALKENPYSRERGKIGAYIRYLRYNVDGWYNRKSADIRKELKEKEKRKKMTELQQKEFEELYEQLRQEESCCENCGDWRDYGAAACEGCGTHGNMQDIEALIASLEGDEKT